MNGFDGSDGGLAELAAAVEDEAGMGGGKDLELERVRGEGETGEERGEVRERGRWRKDEG